MSETDTASVKSSDQILNSNVEPDAGLSSLFQSARISTPHSNRNIGFLDVAKEAEYYAMTHKRRGKAVIFNNKHFDAHTRLNERRGTEVDGAKLYQTLTILGFDTKIHEDLSASEMLSKAEAYGKENYEDADCFVCCILSHGDMGVLYGRDGKFPTDMMFSPFHGDACPSLAGKPKLFIIQACQGDKLDRGVTLMGSKDEADAGNQTYKIPIHADFLIAYSTVPGYYSWRNTAQGSWFVQAITEVFNKYGKEKDLLSMLTIVNLKVAYDFMSCVPNDPEMDRKKQVPCITSMLTRKVLFTQKM